MVHPKFNIEAQLRNICLKIPLLQSLTDIPIYAKIVNELCLKKLGRKRKEPPTIHFIGNAAILMRGKNSVDRYEYPGNLVALIHIQGILLPIILIDMGATINIMTLNTMQQLRIASLHQTPIVLELTDRSK